MWLNKAQAVQRRAELLASGALTDEQRDYHIRQTAFLSSCERGDAPAALEALQGDTMTGTLVHAVDASGTSGLALAAKHGHTEAMEALLRFGARACGSDDARPPLHWAADAGHLAACRLLLAGVEDGAHATIASSRARVDARDSFGFTALLDAARAERADMVALLLASGADVNAATPSGMTSLHFAAQKGCMPVAQALLAGGADMSLRTEGNHTPEMLAGLSSHIEIVRRGGRRQRRQRAGARARARAPARRHAHGLTLTPRTHTHTHSPRAPQALFLNKRARQAAGGDALVSPGRPRADSTANGSSPAPSPAPAAPAPEAAAAPAAAPTPSSPAQAAPAPAPAAAGGGGGGH